MERTPATLRELLAAYPADSLSRPLRRFEAEHGRSPAGAEAGFLLGQLHYARGEYRQAAEAFARAAARFAPERKPEARYWQGLSALGLRDPVQARASLDEVVRGGSRRRAEARFAIAEAWVLANRPERAIEELQGLLAENPGDVAAPALDRLTALGQQTGNDEVAREAAARLRGSFPKSLEAARRAPQPPEPAPPAPVRSERGRIAVQIGAFSDVARARGLLEAARRSGFERAQLVSQGRGGATLHLVRLGFYANEADARAAGERASREMGVAYRLVRNP